MELREIVKTCLRDFDRWEVDLQAEQERLTESGHRLVTSKQHGDEIVFLDDITGEELWRGPYDEEPRGSESWVHSDNLGDNVEMADTEIPGLPEGLAEYVRQWVLENLHEARVWAEG